MYQLQNLSNLMEIRFPENMQQYQTCSWPAIKQQIQKEKKYLNFKASFRYAWNKKQVLYVRCSRCTASMRFLYYPQTQELKLTKYKNLHFHKESSSRRQQFNDISHFIKDLPHNLETNSIKKIVMKNFGIGSSRFYYIHSRIKNQSKTFHQVMRMMLGQQSFVFTQPYQLNGQHPQLVLIISKKMLVNYSYFGDSMTFDFTYSVIKESHQNGKKFRIGAIIGTSMSKKIVPFSIVVSTDQTYNRYLTIFRTFFEAVTKVRPVPQTIISDESQAFKSALQTLKNEQNYDFLHLLDSFHILFNLKKRLQDTTLIYEFKKLIHARTIPEFDSVLNDLYRRITPNDIKHLHKFLDNSHLYCYSKISPRYFGFSSTDSPSQKFNDMIKVKIPQQIGLGQAIYRVYKLCEQLGDKVFQFQTECLEVQKLFGNYELKDVRLSLDKKLYAKFLEQLSKIHSYYIQAASETSFIVGSDKGQFKVTIHEDSVECQCKSLVKCGICCSHILKCYFMKLLNQKRLTQLINPRWIVNYEKKIAPLRKSTGKLTRRRKIWR